MLITKQVEAEFFSVTIFALESQRLLDLNAGFVVLMAISAKYLDRFLSHQSFLIVQNVAEKKDYLTFY